MNPSNCTILVTGADGFIGKNLVVRLRELSNVNVLTFVRGDDVALLPQLVAQVNAVVHLAGENRPANEAAFADVNTGLTTAVCKAIEQEFRNVGRWVSLVLASSTQAELDTPYGRSKLAAEDIVNVDINNMITITLY
jgi:UDP-2-acetamido-2,6-beta-L-arabino-hexul-4-ose reductase